MLPMEATNYQQDAKNLQKNIKIGKYSIYFILSSERCPMNENP